MSIDKTIFEKLDLKTLLIVGLMIALFLTNIVNSCNAGKQDTNIVKVDGKKYELLSHTVDTIKVPQTTTIYKPGKTIYKDNTIYVPLPTKIDSALVAKEYFAQNIYKDSITLKDGLGTVIIIDTLSQNKIKGRKFEAKYNQVIIKDKEIVKDLAKLQVYIGGQAGFDKKNLVNFVGPSIVIKTKSDKLYSISAGYGLGGTVVVQGGLLWKIKVGK